jgi:hypothetical protein
MLIAHCSDGTTLEPPAFLNPLNPIITIKAP